MYRDVYDTVCTFPDVYRNMMKSVLDNAIIKNNDFAVIRTENFKTLFLAFSASMGAKTIKEFKTLLKQNGCLLKEFFKEADNKLRHLGKNNSNKLEIAYYAWSVLLMSFNGQMETFRGIHTGTEEECT